VVGSLVVLLGLNVAQASAPGETWIVVRGNDNGIYYKAESWTNWVQLPGETNNAPSAVLKDGALDIVVIGTNGTLYFGSLPNPADPSTFTGWTAFAGSTPSAPSIA
jgi:hypothetical protein